MPKNKKKFKPDPATAIKSFSKNLLGLKFMQRAKKEAEKVEETKDDDGSFDTSLCNKLKNKQQYIINHSYQFCERLKFGRLSFQGMNPEIEQIMIRNSDEYKKRGPPSSDGSSSDNEIDESEEEEVDDILDRIQ